MPFSDTEAASADINSKIDKVYSVSLSLMVKEANDRSKYFQTEKGQKAIASGALGNSSGSLDMIFLNGTKINSVPSVSSSEILAHEIGHNIAKLNLHGTGDYEYEQEGLQSNKSGGIHPTQQNVMNIINDERNRSTIKE